MLWNIGSHLRPNDGSGRTSSPCLHHEILQRRRPLGAKLRVAHFRPAAAIAAANSLVPNSLVPLPLPTSNPAAQVQLVQLLEFFRFIQ